ncbi:hypothetical protein Lal_00011998 [Lupinus albus]|nr:hypothetical protein Lal_00011998 [Lupinus albus]
MQNNGVTIIARTLHMSSAKDRNPIYANMSYFRVIKQIWELDYIMFQLLVFCCMPYQSWDSRLSEGLSPGRERLTWEGEILGYTEGFSLEREWSRLSESWLAWARNMTFWTCRGCKILKSRLSEKGSPGRVKSWAIPEDSRPSESCLA